MRSKKLAAILVGGAIAATLFDFLIGPLVGGLLAGYLLSEGRTGAVKTGISVGTLGIVLYTAVSVVPVLPGSNTLTEIFVFDSVALLGTAALLLTFSILTSIAGCVVGGKLSALSGENEPMTA